ncbi:MAG: glucose-1-phosphate thymidylyltransferase [Elusimicrobiota bacterium]
MFSPKDFFSEDNTIFSALFRDTEYVWEGLRNISRYLEDNLQPNVSGIEKNGPLVMATTRLENGAIVHAGAFLMDNNIQLCAGCTVEPGAFIKGPAVIGENTQVRHSAYIRGNVIAGDSCVIGHSTEVKNSVLLGESKAGHFAYIGDSILGKVNLGAGTKLANLKVTGSLIVVSAGGRKYETGLRKFGAIIGDGSETGCNSVTSPGTIISKDSILYPNTTARGYYVPKTIIKLRQNIEEGEKS